MALNSNVGWAFPIRCNANGRVATVGGRANETPTVGDVDLAVRTGAYLVLSSDKGERVMLHQFGVGAHRYLFKPLTHLMGGFLENDMREQLSWFATRSRVGHISALIDSKSAEIFMTVQLTHSTFSGESVLKVLQAAT
mgnify:CR=1 FL=1